MPISFRSVRTVLNVLIWSANTCFPESPRVSVTIYLTKSMRIGHHLLDQESMRTDQHSLVREYSHAG